MESTWAELRTVRFVLQGKQKEAEQARIRFAGDTRSDHLALLNAFQVILVRVLAICVIFFCDKSWPILLRAHGFNYVQLITLHADEIHN